MINCELESLQGIIKTFAALSKLDVGRVKNVFIDFDSEKNYAPTLFGDIPYNSKGDMIQAIFIFNGEKWSELPRR